MQDNPQDGNSTDDVERQRNNCRLGLRLVDGGNFENRIFWGEK